MNHAVFVVIYLLVMGALIVGLDVAFLRNHFALRLITNISVVAVFAVVYIAFLRNVFQQ